LIVRLAGEIYNSRIASRRRFTSPLPPGRGYTEAKATRRRVHLYR
jgi:hypothetical protein